MSKPKGSKQSACSKEPLRTFVSVISLDVQRLLVDQHHVHVCFPLEVFFELQCQSGLSSSELQPYNDVPYQNSDTHKTGSEALVRYFSVVLEAQKFVYDHYVSSSINKAILAPNPALSKVSSWISA
jgi:hypothetical protein